MSWWKAWITMLRKLLHAPQDGDDKPPESSIPKKTDESKEHQEVLGQALHEITHRDRVLRALEAKVKAMNHDWDG